EINIADTNNVIEVVIRGGNSGHTRVPNPDGGGWIDLTDINRDGEVNIADVNAMIDIILNQ
ncbi:MAG: FAD-binding oxidoreductase, partial [Muribaculaceae bacterium]|nr:FAD-binding oxidoreductase [Muribaculaceae bacterium]